MNKYFFYFFLFFSGIGLSAFSQNLSDSTNNTRSILILHNPSFYIDSIPKVRLPDSLGGDIATGKIAVYVYLNNDGTIKNHKIFFIHLINKQNGKIIANYMQDIKQRKSKSRIKIIEKYDKFISNELRNLHFQKAKNSDTSKYTYIIPFLIR